MIWRSFYQTASSEVRSSYVRFHNKEWKNRDLCWRNQLMNLSPLRKHISFYERKSICCVRECPRAVVVVATILQNGFQVSNFFCNIHTSIRGEVHLVTPAFHLRFHNCSLWLCFLQHFYGTNIFYVRDSFIEWTSEKTATSKPGLGLFDSRMARNSIYVNTEWQILDDVYKRLFMNIFWIIELSSKIDKPAAKRSAKVEKCNFLKA